MSPLPLPGMTNTLLESPLEDILMVSAKNYPAELSSSAILRKNSFISIYFTLVRKQKQQARIL